MLYSDWVTALGDILEYPITDATSAEPSSDPNFNEILGRAIDYTENRIQRDLDLLATYVTDTTGVLTANNRLFALPTDVGIFLVVTQVNVTVGGVKQPPLLPVSRDYLAQAWPLNVPLSPTPSIPVCWAMFDNANILVGPCPDSAYPVEIVGTQRVAQLSSTNTSNFLTTSLPDLYLAASLVFMNGFQRDFGSQADDPKMAQSWENTYQLLKTPALVEESRKKWAGPAHTGRLPSPTVAAAI